MAGPQRAFLPEFRTGGVPTHLGGWGTSQLSKQDRGWGVPTYLGRGDFTTVQEGSCASGGLVLRSHHPPLPTSHLWGWRWGCHPIEGSLGAAQVGFTPAGNSLYSRVLGGTSLLSSPFLAPHIYSCSHPLNSEVTGPGNSVCWAVPEPAHLRAFSLQDAIQGFTVVCFPEVSDRHRGLLLCRPERRKQVSLPSRPQKVTVTLLSNLAGLWRGE